jgi:putative ABC transport system substrate-binding protein
MSQQRQSIAAFAARNRIVLAGGWGAWTKDGALLTYGPDTVEVMRRVAVYVDKILRGARPGDLPMERPTRFELTVNTQAAKALGLTIPQSLLVRADAVIQ